MLYEVITDIQRAHRYRPRGERFQLAPVDLRLLLLAGKEVAGHERDFGPVQADPLGPALERTRHIADQTGIDPP